MRVFIKIRHGWSGIVIARYSKTARTEPLRPYEKETIQKVGRLIEAVTSSIQDMSEAELSKRQGELYRLIKKVLSDKRYARIRARVQLMVSNLQANERAVALTTIPELRTMV